MNAIFAKQLVWRSEEDFETESLLNQSLSFTTFKIYITAIFTRLVLELHNNKNLRHWFKATLTLETSIVGYICNIHGYQRGICDGFEMKLT